MKAASLLAALPAALLVGSCLSTLARASVGPALDNPASPSDASNFSPNLSDLSSAATPIDTRLEVGGELGIFKQLGTLQAGEPHRLIAPTLSLRPTIIHTAIYTDFTVGHNVARFHPEQPNAFTFRSPASTHFADESRFLRSIVVGKDFLDALAERFDVNDDERPWSTTTTVHMLASTKDFFEPFATLAYEEDAVETYDRFGIGGGLQFRFDENTTLGGEAIYFNDRVNDALPRETRFLAKFELDF